MDFTSAAMSVFALIFVLSLIVIVSILIRKYGTERISGAEKNLKKRLSIKEVKVIDPKHKLILIGRDDKEHLLVVGMDGISVIETQIDNPQAQEEDSQIVKK